MKSIPTSVTTDPPTAADYRYVPYYSAQGYPQLWQDWRDGKYNNSEQTWNLSVKIGSGFSFSALGSGTSNQTTGRKLCLLYDDAAISASATNAATTGQGITGSDISVTLTLQYYKVFDINPQ